MGNSGSQSNNIDTRKFLIPVRVGEVTDWGGHKLSKQIFNELEVGDIVRVQLEATEEAVAWAKERDAAEEATQNGGYIAKPRYKRHYGGVVAMYFEITKIKDGTYWGKAYDAYTTLHDFGILEEGDKFTFRKENIMEIPLRDFFGYNKKRLKKLEQYIQPDKNKRQITGVG